MPQRSRSVGTGVRAGLALIPWWVAAAVMVLLALGLTVLLRNWVQTPGPGGAARQLVFELLRWGVPALWGLWVLWGKRSGAQAVDGLGSNSAEDGVLLRGLTWAGFEKLVGEAFRLRRFAVLANAEAPGAGAVDMVLRKGGETHLVLSRHWRDERLGVQTLRDLQLTMSERSAVSAFVLTSGHFSDDARAFAKATAIHLVDGPRLARWLTAAKRSLQSGSGSAQGGLATASSAAISPPLCPKCSASMSKRQARRGVHAGTTFWSCNRYPRCHGLMPLVAYSGAMSPGPEV